MLIVFNQAHKKFNNKDVVFAGLMKHDSFF